MSSFLGETSANDQSRDFKKEVSDEHQGASSEIAAQTLTIPMQIALQLAKDILSGRIAAGQKLSEQKLAERFRISRGPIRDAIALLERNCFVQSPPRQSARVNTTTRSDIEQLFAVRGVLLGLVARYAVVNAVAEDIKSLDREVEALNEIHNSDPLNMTGFFLQTNITWNALLMASHARMISQISSLFSGSPLWQIAIEYKIAGSRAPFSGNEIINLWETVVEALIDRDPERAQKAATDIPGKTWQIISQSFPEDSQQPPAVKMASDRR